MPRKRTIAVVTGSRAEFGLLQTVMRAVRAHPRLTLRTVVAGLHWTMGTWRDVRDAGFTIDEKVRMQVKGQTGRAADVRALAKGVERFGAVFDDMKPDFVIVLGDRIEAFAAASAASVGGVRVAHVHGGDRAEGVADEAMRHAVSKLAHVHFPGSALSRKRLVRMGESPEVVFDCGSPAVDGWRDVQPVDDPPAFIVAQHPVGERDAQERRWMNDTLDAVWSAMGHMGDDAWCLAVAPNSDPGSDGIRRALDLQPGEGHLPRAEFLSHLAGAKAIVGNSSAGLIEAAALRIPCVNIGPRQAGREKPANVVDCDYGYEPVKCAIKRAIKLDLRRMRHPYGDGHAGERIPETLAAIDLRDVPVRKLNAY